MTDPPTRSPHDPKADGETRGGRILYQVAASLSRSLQLDELLQDALHTLEEQLDIALSAVYLVERSEQGERFELAAHRGFSAQFEVEKLEPASDAEWLRTCLQEVRPWVGREPLDGDDGAVSPRGKREGVQAWTMLPLVSRGQVVGLLLAASGDLDKFSPEEVELLEILGPDLGAAIQNARLFQLVQRGRDDWLHTFDSVEDRIAVLDGQLRVIRANRALLSALERPPAEVIGRTCRELVPAICGEDCPHRRALTGERVELEHDALGRRYRIVAYPSSLGVIHVARDVTAEKQREEQLIQAEKLSAAGAVLAGVAHELNNPLTVVIAYSDLLSRIEETAGFRDEVHQILRSALRCQSIVRNLFAFSRRDAPEETEVDINQLVRETLPLFGYQMRVSGVRVEDRLSPTVPAIVGDRNRLQVLLVNVLNNAYQAVARSRHGGWIRVATRSLREAVEIQIEDDGPGIPEDVLPRVFEPFYTTKSGEGSGLGLALSLTIARDHGGDIQLESEPGVKTAVRVTLPVAPRIEPTVEEAAPEPGCLTDRRILFVDDEPDVRSLVSAALGMFGAEVVTTANGAKALELLATDDAFDVVFTDLRMPVMGGDELIDEVRKRWPALLERSLLTTGDVAAPAADAAIAATGRPCLPKPFNIRELVSAIRTVIDAAPD